MASGPGKYDAACTTAREMTGGTTVLVLVVDGVDGPGFSVQTDDVGLLRELPILLRTLADQIQGDTDRLPEPS